MEVPRTLSNVQAQHLQEVLRFCPEGHRLRKLVLQCRTLPRWWKVNKLAGWMTRAIALGFSGLGQFAKPLGRDLEAVTLALETPLSNGPLEGQINRLKVIKRQMYRRAGFELLQLLRARVLPWDVSGNK